MDDRGPEDDSQFARSGISGTQGKYTEVIKFYVDETALTDMMRLCHSKGITASELMRAAAYQLLYGKTPEQGIAERQREMLAPLDGFEVAP